MILTERDQARFWSKVALPNANGCMLWLAGKSNVGYGQFSLGGAPKRAHRISYELAYGPIPQGLFLDHLCRVRHCVAPLHLEAVTPAENIRRVPDHSVFGRHKSAKTHCPHGHPYDDANTYVNTSGARVCRACRRQQQRRRPSWSAATVGR